MNDLSAPLLLRRPVVPTLLGLGIALARVLRRRAALGGGRRAGHGRLRTAAGLGAGIDAVPSAVADAGHAAADRPPVLRWAPPVVNLDLAVLNGTGVVLLALAVTRRLR